jgi:hypothetical protein
MAYEKKKKRKKKSTAEPISWNEKDWEIERDLDAIVRAEAVKADPERMKKVKAMAKEKLEQNQRRKEEAQAAISLAAE